MGKFFFCELLEIFFFKYLYYQDGTCNKDKRLGDYAHGEKDLQLHKSSICEYHRGGRCREDSKCTFAHGSVDRRVKFSHDNFVIKTRTFQCLL